MAERDTFHFETTEHVLIAVGDRDGDGSGAEVDDPGAGILAAHGKTPTVGESERPCNSLVGNRTGSDLGSPVIPSHRRAHRPSETVTTREESWFQHANSHDARVVAEAADLRLVCETFQRIASLPDRRSAHERRPSTISHRPNDRSPRKASKLATSFPDSTSKIPCLAAHAGGREARGVRTELKAVHFAVRHDHPRRLSVLQVDNLDGAIGGRDRDLGVERADVVFGDRERKLPPGNHQHREVEHAARTRLAARTSLGRDPSHGRIGAGASRDAVTLLESRRVAQDEFAPLKAGHPAPVRGERAEEEA